MSVIITDFEWLVLANYAKKVFDRPVFAWKLLFFVVVSLEWADFFHIKRTTLRWDILHRFASYCMISPVYLYSLGSQAALGC